MLPPVSRFLFRFSSLSPLLSSPLSFISYYFPGINDGDEFDDNEEGDDTLHDVEQQQQQLSPFAGERKPSQHLGNRQQQQQLKSGFSGRGRGAAGKLTESHTRGTSSPSDASSSSSLSSSFFLSLTSSPRCRSRQKGGSPLRPSFVNRFINNFSPPSFLFATLLCRKRRWCWERWIGKRERERECSWEEWRKEGGEREGSWRASQCRFEKRRSALALPLVACIPYELGRNRLHLYDLSTLMVTCEEEEERNRSLVCCRCLSIEKVNFDLHANSMRLKQ